MAVSGVPPKRPARARATLLRRSGRTSANSSPRTTSRLDPAREIPSACIPSGKSASPTTSQPHYHDIATTCANATRECVRHLDYADARRVGTLRCRCTAPPDGARSLIPCIARRQAFAATASTRGASRPHVVAPHRNAAVRWNVLRHPTKPPQPLQR